MRLVRNLLLLLTAGALAAVRSLLSPRSLSDESGGAEQRGHRARGTGLKRRAFRVAVLFAVLGVLGFLGAASGLIPIKASSGHWAITRWFLDFSKRRSVVTHTVGLKPPPLDDARLVMKGAGHYEVGCAACHGSPQLQTPRIAQAMTPPPPHLPPRISRWEPEELFYIVKHGIKFTGMPAWPAQRRDDEVWAVVAFLRELPRLDAEQYRRLAGVEAGAGGELPPLTGLTGSAQVPRAVVQSCARCHGADGRGRGQGAFPQLAGQRPDYLFASLQAFARGERHSGIMGPIAAGLSPEAMRELAGYYAGLPRSTPPQPPADSAQLVALGESIARRGIPERRVPSCASCHGQTGAPRNPLYPDLSGQHAEYLALQLELFRSGNRGGTPYAHLMGTAAAHLTPEQMRAVALYYASLAPAHDLPPP
jgi:cytochrome c553